VSVARAGASETASAADHDRRVRAVAAAVRRLADGHQHAHIDKGGVHHVVPLPRDRRFSGRSVDVSGLNRVLEIDAEGRRCVAEPGVTFADAVRATLPHGLVPAVVPELEGITLGGAVAGCSVESGSFRHGGFHDTCLEYEVVTGAGEVLTCSREVEPFLFEMVHGSYGTHGILTRLAFRLVPAEPYVHMRYETYRSASEFHEALMAQCRAGDVDFIDGIVHAPDRFVLCLGTFVRHAPYSTGYRWLNVYYRSTRERSEDYLTTPDYLFRYDTEAHWVSRTFPPLEWKPVRFLVGKAFLGSTNLIRWSKRLEALFRLKRRPDILVDLFIPSRRCPEFYEWYLREVGYFPLWVVPYRIERPYPWIDREYARRFDDELFLDLAVYGMRNGDPGVDVSRVLEEKTHELGGIKTLISRNHYTEERFWEIYDRENYAKAKARLDPHGLFPDLYEKLGRAT
jgi:FAD/FMN-containing dehydrogenase